MADSGLFWVLVVAVVVSTVVLAVVCLRCRRSPQGETPSQWLMNQSYFLKLKSLVSSRQFASAKPQPQRTTCPQTNPDLNSEPLPSHLLSPYFPSSDLQNHRREQSLTATETESNPSYENPPDGADYINAESDADEPGYIMVLPEEHIVGTNDSRGSTPSSDIQHDYENVPEKKFEDDDDDDEGNYVNLQDGALRPSSFSSSEE
ncbi:uncharacterized protein AB9W97_000141 isoform 3-T3 [Spinachia spinachia]